MQPKRIPAGPGQESVWDYPRPPRVENSPRRVRILLAERVIVDTRRALRVLETSSPPVYYFPREDVAARLTPTGRDYVCEFKGRAIYYTVAVDGRVETDAAWSYVEPTPDYTALKDYIAVYPARMDACYIDDERVRPQSGEIYDGLYGGWITSDIVGPFKGESGTENW